LRGIVDVPGPIMARMAGFSGFSHQSPPHCGKAVGGRGNNTLNFPQTFRVFATCSQLYEPIETQG
jgi:hypothetical protein